MNSCWRRLLTSALILALGAALSSTRAGDEPQKSRRVNRGRSAPTTEPGPPLSLEFRLVSLQKNVSGGVASLAIDASSDVNMSGVSVVVNLPADVSFTDGSRTKTWVFNLAGGVTFEISNDLLVQKDGKFVVNAEASGNYQGKTVHRGEAYKLLVGTQDKLPPAKDGAIEYQGVPGGGV